MVGIAVDTVTERRARGEAVGGAGWEAVRMVLAGLLPECRAAAELGERGCRRLEASIAKAVVEVQQLVVEMLHTYREATRRMRAAKHEALDTWWAYTGADVRLRLFALPWMVKECALASAARGRAAHMLRANRYWARLHPVCFRVRYDVWHNNYHACAMRARQPG